MPRPAEYSPYVTPGHAMPSRFNLCLIQRLADWCVEVASGEHPTNCWKWQGYTDKDGYAEMKFRGKKYRAARLSYAAFNGMIDRGNDIDHTCRNRACVNPEHLVQRDPIENRVILRDQRATEALSTE